MIKILKAGNSEHRGGGRYIESLLGVIPNSKLINSLEAVDSNDTLLLPFWRPFEIPVVTKKYCQKQILCILDVIPLAYPDKFPLGIKGRYNLWRNKNALQHFDNIVTISEHSRSEIVRILGVDPDRVEVIYPTLEKKLLVTKGADTDIHQKLNIKKNEYFIYVGDANWNKNLVNLARAVKHANVNCVLVGKVFERLKNIKTQTELDEYLWELRHKELVSFRDFAKLVWGDMRFVFAGYVSDEELIDLYDYAKANILLSFDEGFGYSYFEASARECLSILSDVPIFHETAGDAALFAHTEDWLGIAQIFDRFEDKKNTSTVKDAKLRIQKLLNFESIAQKWGKLL